MKLRRANQSCRAMTLMEVAVVVIVLFVLVAMILPNLARSHRAPRIECASNLKQIGLAYRLWKEDNGGKYPMGVSVTNGGTMELANGRNVWINFFVMSNQLTASRVLHCPSDTDGFIATNSWVRLNNQNVSYFVGLDATPDNPQAILSGDDNFEIGGVPVKSGLLKVSTNELITWSTARHKFNGNILLTDGSVQMVNNSGLTNLVRQTGLATNRLAIP